MYAALLVVMPVSLHCRPSASEQSADIVVYGATPAGISAALASASPDHSVLLIEPTRRIGGMMTNGLSHSDFHSFEALDGPFLEFSQRVLRYYETEYGEESTQVRDCWKGTHGEPSVNRRVFQTMLTEKPSITILRQYRLIAAAVEDHRITRLRFSRPDSSMLTISAKIVIDASYEGDLFAAANVPFRVGCEARSEYGDSLAPEQSDDQLQG